MAECRLAWVYSSNMFHPENEHLYNKILQKNDPQPSIVKANLTEYVKPIDLKMAVSQMLQSLRYGPDFDSDRFELALHELGEFLGFTSQMPDRDTGNGPDVLWCMSDGQYLILEAKNQKTKRDNFKIRYFTAATI